MINEIKRTYKASHETKNANVIIASIYYNKGGTNFYNYKNEEHGYYFSIVFTIDKSNYTEKESERNV